MKAASGTRRIASPRLSRWLFVVAAVAGVIVLIGARFELLHTRDDVWFVDRHSNRVCTFGFEAIEPPCWPALAVGLAKLGLIRPNGGDWTVNAAGLHDARVRDATGPCEDATVWYADNARNLFLSDGHAYAVDAPMPLPFQDAVRVCAFPARHGRFALHQGSTAAPAVQMR